MAEELQQQDSQEQLETPTSNKRIAKNALMLYIRMFFTMIVGLYTSRVVLATLGVEDYGIYGVVGGVVAMMGFLNASMSGATSRFLTFELGRGDQKRLAETFSSALIVHIGIALIVFVLAETVGLWFLCNKLVIPAGRMNAAHWVYQCSILSAMMGIIQVPYNACIISHEKMDIYAYIEILHVVLKLIIVYLLAFGNFDKLIFFSILMLLVSISIIFIYRTYCVYSFGEAKFNLIWNKDILKPLLSFSGWDIYGNASVTIRQQGINFLINIFFGVVYNAATSIAGTVNGLLSSMANNIIQAFRPQIIKNYASNDIKNMQSLLSQSIKFSVIAFGYLFIPIFLEMSYILKVWLKTVPLNSVSFCRILMIATLIGVVNSILVIAIHATGKIKMLSILSGTLYLLNIPSIYFVFRINPNANYAFYLMTFFNLLIFLANLFILKKNIPSVNLRLVISSLAIGSSVILLCFLLSIPIYMKLGDNLLGTVSLFLFNLFGISAITYFFVFDKSMRIRVRKFILRRSF